MPVPENVRGAVHENRPRYYALCHAMKDRCTVTYPATWIRSGGATAIGTASLEAIVGISGTWFALKRDRREGRIQAIAEAKETIELHKEQTGLMRQQEQAREGEWRRLEQTWHEREARLEKRIEAVEGDYRRLVLTVTSIGLCANAPDCANYNPGDRRRRRISQPYEAAATSAQEGATR
jgi:hypothetical protein